MMLPRFGKDADCSNVIRIEVEGNVQRTVFSRRQFSPIFASSLAGGPYFWISIALSASKSCGPADGAELGSPKYDHNRAEVILALPCLAVTWTPIWISPIFTGFRVS